MGIRSILRAALLAAAITFVAGASPSAAQGPRFQWIYGGTHYDAFYGLTATADGGFLAVGISTSYISNDNDVYVVRTNSCGGIVWAATYDIGNGGADEGRKVVRGVDGGYVIVGTTTNRRSCCSTGTDAFLMKIDDNGAMLWTKTYPGLYDDAGSDIATYGANEYIIAGRTSSFGNGQFDGFLMRVDLGGNPIYARAYGGASYDEFNGLSVAANGEIVAAGSTFSYTTDNRRQIYAVRVKADLSVLWSYSYGADSSDEVANDVVAMSDNTINVLGYTTLNEIYGGEQPYLLKLTSTGNCYCDAIYAFADSNRGELTEGRELTNGDLAVTGFYFNEPLSLGRFDVLLMRIGQKCNRLLAMQYVGPWRDQGRGIVPIYSQGVLMPTGYAIAGHGNTYTNGGTDDAYIIRTDANGTTGCNEYKSVMAEKSPNFCVRKGGTVATLFAVACNGTTWPDYNDDGQMICSDCESPFRYNGGEDLSLRSGERGSDAIGDYVRRVRPAADLPANR